MIERLIVALVIVGAVLIFSALRRSRVAAQARRIHPTALVPADLLGPDRRWLVFTTPFCATCGPVVEHLRSTDPDTDVVTVDASERVDVARLLGVSRAPTALLADRDGVVLDRRVGAAAVLNPA